MGGVNNPEVDVNWRIPESLWERVEPLLPIEGPKPKGGSDLTPKVIPRIMRVRAVGGRSPESGTLTNCGVAPDCSLAAILRSSSLLPAGC